MGTTRTKPLNETEIAYFAGYFDGEGCVNFNRHSLRVSISSCCPRSINRLDEAFGGRSSDGSYRDRPNARDYSRWVLHGEKALRFLHLIFPYSVEKRPQIKLALTYYDAVDKDEKAEIRAQIAALKKVNYYAKDNTN